MATNALDQTSGVPLYRQIIDILRAEIVSGQVSAEEPMTEAKLIDRFGVSLAPIRQALSELTRDGYVYRKQGRGTFPVVGPRVDRPVGLKTGDLYRYLALQGLKPSSSVTGIERVSGSEAIRSRLGLAEGENLLHFTRLMTLDGQPFALNDIYIRAPEDFSPSEEDLKDGGSAFALLESRYGIALEHAEHEAWATSATKDVASTLKLETGSPVLVIDTVFYLTGGVAGGWRTAVHRPESFKFHFAANS